MDQTWVNLAIQIPLVAAFIIFTLKIVDIFVKQQQTRDVQFLAAIQQRDQEWREFVSSMQARYSDGLTAVAREVNDASRQLATNTNKLDAIHNTVSSLDARMTRKRV